MLTVAAMPFLPWHLPEAEVSTFRLAHWAAHRRAEHAQVPEHQDRGLPATLVAQPSLESPRCGCGVTCSLCTHTISTPQRLPHVVVTGFAGRPQQVTCA